MFEILSDFFGGDLERMAVEQSGYSISPKWKLEDFNTEIESNSYFGL